MNREYSSKELSFLLDLKERVVSKHKKCGGVGYLDADKPCDCMMVFQYLRELYYSRIPMDYWTLSLGALEVDPAYKKLVSDYIKNIDNAIDQGLGIIFLGDRGIGKTSLMCEIGKAAVVRRYDVYYNLIQNVVNDHFTDDQPILHRIQNADLVLVDELDKVMMKKDSNLPKHIDSFFRNLLPNRKSMLISSNLGEEELEEKFQLTSLMKRYIKPIDMEGEDFSEKKQQEWMEKLKSGHIDFMTETILKAAREFYANEDRANAKEFDSIF